MEFTCQSCNGTIDADPEWAGQASSCPHCEAELVIPAAPATKRAAPAPVPPPGSSAPPPVAPPPPRSAPAPVQPPAPAPAVRSAPAPAPRVAAAAPPPYVAAGHPPARRPSVVPAYNPQANSAASVVYIIIGVLAVALVVAMFMLSQNRKAVAASKNKPKPVPAKVSERTGMAELETDLVTGQLVLKSIRDYSKRNGGLFPRDLDDLISKRLHRDDLLCMGDLEGDKMIRFEYYKGYNISSESGIILSSPKPVKAKRAVIRVDGSAEILSEKVFQSEINPGTKNKDTGAEEPPEARPKVEAGEDWEDA